MCIDLQGGIFLLKAVVFDLDHTLFDRYETLKLCIPLFREKFRINPRVTDDYFARELIWADKNFVHHGWKEIHAHLLKCNIFAEEPSFEEYEAALLSFFHLVAVKFPFTIPVLQELRSRGYKIGLITNGEKILQQKKLELLGIKDYFDCIVYSGETPYRKPQTEIFNIVCDSLKIPAKEMMFVGDHPLFDVDGSRRAGFVPVWVKTTGTWIYPEVEKPEIQIETVKELLDILD